MIDTAQFFLCRHGSHLSGDGVFAAKLIPADFIVAVVTGRRLHRDSIDWGTYDGLIMQVGNDWYLEGIGGIDDYINHSCEPNLAFTSDGGHFVTLRSIEAGEELTFDYSTCQKDATWSIDCLCNKPSCRKIITGFDGLSPQDQKRLKDHCLPYIRSQDGFTDP